jgi:alpha-tubulin suppressor-like RCC1 family protein
MPAGDAGIVPTLRIAPGLFFTCVELSGGSVECWGYNANGTLGNGAFVDSTSAVPVSNLKGVLGIAAGGYDVCAVQPQQTVACWGDNFDFQLGQSMPATASMPVLVPGVTDAIQVSVGADFACALRADRTAECWGNNDAGQLGNGALDGPDDNVVSAPPGPVAGLAGAAAISAGGSFACALLVDGSVQCWGDDSAGQLGSSVVSGRSPVPVAVPGLTGVRALSAGGANACALLNDGTVTCWGDDSDGQLGNGTTSSAPSPPVKVSGLSGVASISVGEGYACAVLASGTSACWGTNQEGTLGNGTQVSSSTPVPVSGLVGVAGIAAGSEHTCAQLADGSFSCWGNDQDGQLGDGTMNRALTPVAVHL